MLLLLACAAPSDSNGLVLLDPAALDAGVALDVNGWDESSALPVSIGPLDSAWAELPDGQSIELDPLGEELWSVWLDGDELVYEVLWVGEDVDPDSVYVQGHPQDLDALALALDATVTPDEQDPDAAWLSGPGVLHAAAGERGVEPYGVWPVQIATDVTKTAFGGAGTLGTPQGGKGPASWTSERVHDQAGSWASSSGPSPDAGVDTRGLPITGEGMIGFTGNLAHIDPALVGFYVTMDNHTLTIDALGGYEWRSGSGMRVKGWLSHDTELNELLLYSGAEGPVSVLQIEGYALTDGDRTFHRIETILFE
jgi:hypothetical protein